MMSVVKYHMIDGRKVYYAYQALRDSGWNLNLDNLTKKCVGIKLRDRNNLSHIESIKKIEHIKTTNDYLVYFERGGWQCLDNCINQFERIYDEKEDSGFVNS
jgi:hypothetical protein